MTTKSPTEQAEEHCKNPGHYDEVVGEIACVITPAQWQEFKAMAEQLANEEVSDV